MENIKVLVTRMAYESTEVVIDMRQCDFDALKDSPDGTKSSDDGLFMYQIATEEDTKRVRSEAANRRYSMAIQRKYGVGADWQENRWFVEQVRPHL